MPTETATAKPLPRLRGEGLVYRGSLTDFHGQAVVAMTDCNCVRCWDLDPWDPARRVLARLTSGVTLEHARTASFVEAT